MNHRAIQSEINKITSEILQLSDRQYFSEEEEARRKPALESKLKELELSYAQAVSNIEVKN